MNKTNVIKVFCAVVIILTLSMCSNSAKNMPVAGTDWFNLTMVMNGESILSNLDFYNNNQCRFVCRTLRNDTIHNIEFYYEKNGIIVTLSPLNGGGKWELEFKNKDNFKFNKTGDIQISDFCSSMGRNQAK